MIKFLAKNIAKHPFAFILGAGYVYFRFFYLKENRKPLNPRSRSFQKFAEIYGFDFNEYDFSIYKSDLADIPFFSKLSGGLFTNILTKDNLQIFDFIYPSGKKDEIVSQTVAVFKMQQDTSFPSFTLHPSGLLKKLTFSYHNKNRLFENSVFEKNYSIETEDENEIQEVFTANIQEFFAENKDWTVIFQKGFLIITRQGKITEDNAIGKFTSEVFKIAGLLGLKNEVKL